jgi:hypothetical protein
VKPIGHAAHSSKHINDRRSRGKGLGRESPAFLLRRATATDKRGAPYLLERFFGMGLDAVAAILIFIVALAALNRSEFGRFD